MQAKLDELLRVVGGAREDLIGIERTDHAQIQDARPRSTE
jgi:low affinity Fe/Cu permease